jgi:hypothetical protein
VRATVLVDMLGKWDVDHMPGWAGERHGLDDDVLALFESILQAELAEHTERLAADRIATRLGAREARLVDQEDAVTIAGEKAGGAGATGPRPDDDCIIERIFSNPGHREGPLAAYLALSLAAIYG